MRRPFHTLLLAILPVLQILSVNRQSISIVEGVTTLGIAFLFGLVIWFLFSLPLKSLRAAAMPASVFLFLFYIYTPVQLGLLDSSWETMSRNSVLAPLYLGSVLVATWLAYKWKKEKSLDQATQKMNVFSFLVCLLPLLAFLFDGNGNRQLAKENPLKVTAIGSTNDLPNVYWIVLDAYARADVLDTFYGFDNSNFLIGLERRGFQVDSLAKSNYSQTSLSIASILNGDYLHNLSGEINPSSNDRRLLTEMIRENHLKSSLRSLGYKSATFSTGYALTEDPNSDKYYGSRHFLGRNPITGALIKRTPLRFVGERLLVPLNGFEWHRDRVLDNFSNLGQMPGLEPPFFAFAHLVSPHKPYIFSNSGVFRAPDAPFSFTNSIDYSANEDSLYIEQLQFINQKIIQTVDRILENETLAPVIIIQSDHGPDLGIAAERLKILHAYHFPGQVMPEISSPVNTSRTILNHLFDAQIPYLEDIHYWSSYDEPFEFQER